MDFDAIVIGGGPAGAAAATRLATLGRRVAIMERSEFPRRKVCGEYLSWTNWDVFKRLGVWEEFSSMAGPAIRRVAFFARSDRPVAAALPAPRNSRPEQWGRALTRDRLDSLLLHQAERRGAVVFQPWTVRQLERRGNGWQVTASSTGKSTAEEVLTTSMVIHACGSWGRTPFEPNMPAARGGDLLGFKAHFCDVELEEDLMPLLAFPGGYGGMVTAQDGIVSLSCCVRRNQLRELRSDCDAGAGPAVLAHIAASIPVLAKILRGASRRGSWLAAGPIRPGQRNLYQDGIFRVGNAAGEAHPVVAEGISMAVQSGLLAAECITAHCHARRPEVSQIDQAGEFYRRSWLRAFASRIRASKAIASWAMRPQAVRISEAAIRQFPSLLTAGARLGGKSHMLKLQEFA